MSIIDEKIDLIDSANELFDKQTESIDNYLLKEIIKIYAAYSVNDVLVYDPLKASKLEQQIIDIIKKSKYKSNVKSYLRNFDAIGEMNKLLHKDLNGIDISKIIAENEKIKNFTLLIEDQLTGTNKLSIRASELDELVKPLASQIRKDLIIGNTFKDATKFIENQIENKHLGLNQWAKQIARDALNQSDAIQNDEVRKEFDMPYGRYHGSISDNSRPLCHHMVLEHSYFKWDELHSILNPYVKNGVPNKSYTTETGKKQRKGSGIIEGTDASNFAIYRGGYGCKHTITSSLRPPTS